MIEEENLTRKFILHQALKNFEEEKVNAAIFDCYVYAVLSHDKDKEELKKVMKDIKLRRKIGYLDHIKAEHLSAIEYHDEDKDDDPYKYDEETEAKIVEIKEKVALFLSRAIKEEEGESLEEFFKRF